MAGYLHQLARRALQPGSSLHSMAALPYAEPPELVQDAHPAAAEPVATRFAPLSARTHPAQANVLAAGAAMTISAPHASPHPQSETAMQARPAAWLGEVSEPMHGIEPAPPTTTDTGKEGKVLAPVHRDPLVTIERTRSGRQTRQESRTSDPIRVAATPGARLRPQLRPPTQEPRKPSSDPAPEVHIHIGRIELTAVAPSKPPRRDAATTRKPMSLDEYLQQRRKAP